MRILQASRGIAPLVALLAVGAIAAPAALAEHPSPEPGVYRSAIDIAHTYNHVEWRVEGPVHEHDAVTHIEHRSISWHFDACDHPFSRHSD